MVRDGKRCVDWEQHTLSFLQHLLQGRCNGSGEWEHPRMEGRESWTWCKGTGPMYSGLGLQQVRRHSGLRAKFPTNSTGWGILDPSSLTDENAFKEFSS